MIADGIYITVETGITKITQRKNGKMSKEEKPFNSYKNGEILSMGPSNWKGGYTHWNWCGACNRVWDKEHNRCAHCNQLLRIKGRWKWNR
tara:strand:- start:2494 stop:2763 length:270 start_codon:yes stop_codon:yes gene_type:complete